MAAAGKVEALFKGGGSIRPMLGFKRFDSAAVTISAIELVQKIQKHQFPRAHRPRTNVAPKPLQLLRASRSVLGNQKRLKGYDSSNRIS
jgi:hypothetical protein